MVFLAFFALLLKPQIARGIFRLSRNPQVGELLFIKTLFRLTCIDLLVIRNIVLLVQKIKLVVTKPQLGNADGWGAPAS